MYRFSHLSPGYCGELIPAATLNAEFLGRISEQCLDDRRAFPVTQRIPRVGFFDELVATEHTATLNKFEKFKKRVTEVAIGLSQKSLREPIGSQEGNYAISVLQVCQRLGIAEDFKLDFKQPDHTVAYKLAKFDTYVNQLVSFNELPSFDVAEQLFKAIESSKDINLSTKILVCLRLVVTRSRHGQSRFDDTSARFNWLDSALETFLPSNFHEQLVFAMGLRALPMKKDMPFSEKLDSVKKSLKCIDSMQADTDLEKLVQKELLYTTQLTMAKTLSSVNHSYETVQAELYKLIRLDEWDATGFGELAIFEMNAGNPQAAKIHFLKAIELGPPGLAMHHYFLGRLFRQDGDITRATDHLENCLRIDRSAISAAVDLFTLHAEAGDNTSAAIMKARILQDNDLKSQLTAEDLHALKMV